MNNKSSASVGGLSPLDLIAETIPGVPRDCDLIRLPQLAELIARAVADRGDLPLPKAGRRLLDALLGSGQWHGSLASSLVLYRCWATGTEPLAAEDRVVDGFQWPSERGKALGLLLASGLWNYLSMGYSLADVPDGVLGGQPHPRYLAVEREKALQAFDLTDLRSGSAMKGNATTAHHETTSAPSGSIAQTERKNKQREAGKRTGGLEDWSDDERQALVWLVKKVKASRKGQRGWWPAVIVELKKCAGLGRKVPTAERLSAIYSKAGGDMAEPSSLVVSSVLRRWGCDVSGTTGSNPRVRNAFDREAA